jgi:hypothetical protein
MVSPVTPLRRPAETTVTTDAIVFRAVIALPNDLVARPNEGGVSVWRGGDPHRS